MVLVIDLFGFRWSFNLGLILKMVRHDIEIVFNVPRLRNIDKAIKIILKLGQHFLGHVDWLT